MQLPLLITNFKATESATGARAVSLAKIHEQAGEQSGVNVAVAVQSLDLQRVASETSAPVFAQHVDGVDFGSHTGKTPPQLAQRLGASGTLLNHSENRFSDFALLEKAIIKAKQAGLFVVVCAESSQEGAEIMSKYRPDLIAVEPPELIGGDISVSTAQPELITDSVRRIGRKKVLVGAGVKNAQDVKIALELGAVGILVASGITKVHDPESALLDLIAGMSGAQA